MTEPVVLAIDQGTGSTKVLLVDRAGRVRSQGSAPLEQQTPRPGWVEHRPEDLLASVHRAVAAALRTSSDLSVEAVGISNQRESMLLWERSTGRPVSPVLSWQDRRTTDICARLVREGHGDLVRETSGLPLDPMFSAVKAAWLLDAHDVDRRRAADLCLGTVDSWLVWSLTGEHVIEAGNASRTSLVDLSTGDWSPALLDLFGIPPEVLPRIVDSAGAFGEVVGVEGLSGVRLTGVLGDSHAALFAHAGWRTGVAKATYGTGSSVMTLVAPGSPDSSAMCRTIAWRLPRELPALAWEANILSAGSTLTWLAGVLGISVAELVASSADDSAGVMLVPAFNGLGAPWWDPEAVALVTGMSLATTAAHLGRAALDSVILQVTDVLDTLGDVDARPALLMADGGMTSNRDLMARQAAVAGMTVQVSRTSELSALGAAHVAGLGAGMWTLDDLERIAREYDVVAPLDGEAWSELRHEWHRAVARSRVPRRRSEATGTTQMEP